MERIDLREYASERELSVVDSYALLEGGQGDLGHVLCYDPWAFYF